MSDGTGFTDDHRYSERDYHVWHDRFIRFMCIQRRERNQLSFSLYELSLQAEIGGLEPDENVANEFTPNAKSIYDIVAARVMKMLLKEQLVESTGDTNIYRMTEKLIKKCDSDHRGTYGLPTAGLF